MTDYEKMYFELVDALCSKSWMGRHRHQSVLKLAQRLRDNQTRIYTFRQTSSNSVDKT